MEPILGFKDEYRFLSNFWPSRIDFDGIVYPSVENAFQAAKSLDYDIRKEFVGITASESKKKGKTVDLRPDWDAVKIGIMEQLLRIKFNHDTFKKALAKTGDAYLEEPTIGMTLFGACAMAQGLTI